MNKNKNFENKSDLFSKKIKKDNNIKIVELKKKQRSRESHGKYKPTSDTTT